MYNITYVYSNLVKYLTLQVQNTKMVNRFTCLAVCACVPIPTATSVHVDLIITGATILAGGAPTLIDVWKIHGKSNTNVFPTFIN